MGERVWGSTPCAGKSISVYHPGQLSLAIHSWIGTMSTSQMAVLLCGWGVKAGMVHQWLAGKTVWSPCYHGSYLSVSSNGFITQYLNRALYKCPITLLLCIIQYTSPSRINTLIIGHFWDDFYRPDDQTDSVKALKKTSWSSKIRLESHQNHSTMLQ